MAMLKVEHLTFSYPSSYDNIFEDVSFQIDTDWKIGFIGRNGRGKTTFFHLLQKKYDYRGTITSPVQFDYFPYPVSDKSKNTLELLQEVCPSAQDWEFIRELSYLAADIEILYRPFATLSNGEQTKALLAALFLNNGHFLLIDEPTNHLDQKARETVAAYLQRKKGFLLISHDRFFLDSCVDHILSLNKANIDVQSGNFSSWMQNFLQQQEFELARQKYLQKEIQRLEKSSQKSSSWSARTEAAKIGQGPVDRGYIGHKSAKMMKRAKAVAKRQQHAIDEKKALLKNVETAESLKLFPRTYHTGLLASFTDVSVCYDTTVVCPPISFSIRQGERIALDGTNGSGKSSLLKLLLKEPIAHTGEVFLGSGLKISYVPQDASFLSGTLSAFIAQNALDETLFKALLRKMDFSRVQFEKDMRDFSGGQKKKVLIAKSLCEQAHLYVWDEPLNFIDIYSRMQIETLLKTFAPTMIFVEHDRVFRDTIATKTIRLP